MVVVDSYKLHQSAASIENAQRECNADVVIIPGGCTSIVQSMDRCINKPFKDSMRVSWEEWMCGDRPKTMMGNLKQPTQQDVMNWVSKAWYSIKQETLVRSFLVCGISNALDGSEDVFASDDVRFAGVESDDGECSDDDSDVGELGDHFSDDLDSDC